MVPITRHGSEACSWDLMSFLGLGTQAAPLAPHVQQSSRLPLHLLPCPKSLSHSACGPISIATPCDATEESGSFGKVWGEGSGKPIHYRGTCSRVLRVELWAWFAWPAQVELGSGLPARWSGGLPRTGLPGLAWALLTCANLLGASLGSRSGYSCLDMPGLEDPGLRNGPDSGHPSDLGYHHYVWSCPLGSAAIGRHPWDLLAAGSVIWGW